MRRRGGVVTALCRGSFPEAGMLGWSWRDGRVRLQNESGRKENSRLRVFPLKLSPHSWKMAADVPDITSSHDYLQERRGRCLFLCLFLSNLPNTYLPPPTPTNFPLCLLGPNWFIWCFLNKCLPRKWDDRKWLRRIKIRESLTKLGFSYQGIKRWPRGSAN